MSVQIYKLNYNLKQNLSTILKVGPNVSKHCYSKLFYAAQLSY